jgi:hypothetical protein
LIRASLIRTSLIRTSLIRADLIDGLARGIGGTLTPLANVVSPKFAYQRSVRHAHDPIQFVRTAHATDL